MFSFKSIDNFCERARSTLKLNGCKSRPGADLGLWLPTLIPIAFIASNNIHKIEATNFFKINAIASFGLFCVTIVQYLQLHKQKKLSINLGILVCSLFTSFLIWICLKRGVLFSCLSGFFVCMLYAYLLPFVLREFAFSFTFGESAIAVQGAVLFIFAAIQNIFITIDKNIIPKSDEDIATIVLQIGTLGVGLISLLSYAYKPLRSTIGFYFLSASVICIGIIPALHLVLARSPLLWLFEFMFDNINRIYVLGFWVVCSAAAVLCIRYQIADGKKATTAVRKVFHILAVCVFMSGLISECTLLYIASGVVFALFIAIEMLRVFKVPPFGDILQEGFQIYADEKDAGGIALTPLYLLVGCAIPMWLHPCACDLTDSAGLQLTIMLSGVLSIGIGDTAASILGSIFGKHKWPGSTKSVEGTLASIFCQLALVLVLMKLGYIIYTQVALARATIAIVINCLVEAKTDQVDNLILPIITYILLL